MKIFVKLTQLFLILFFVTACKTVKEDKPPLIKDSESESNFEAPSNNKKLEIKISCGDGNIEEFLNDGWTIVKESTEEKICTWKSYPATKECDMEKDKGCKITKPDKVGEEKIYLLEK